MNIRRFGPILTLFTIIILSAGLGRYLYTNNFPGRNLGPFKNTPSNTPTPTILHLDDLKVTQVAPQQPVSINKNCTYHIYYWIDRSQQWPAMIELGGSTYDRKSTQSLFSKWKLDLSRALTAQFYTAVLNVLYGASQNEIDPYLVLTNDWLKQYSETSPETAADRDRGILLYNILEQYNLGRIGPGACEDQPPTPSYQATVNLFDPSPILSDSATPTLTPSIPLPAQGSTHTPTRTITQGRRNNTGTVTITIQPAFTPQPSITIPPTITPTKTATGTAQPTATRNNNPSSTPQLPTGTSTPTWTSLPPATRTNTPLPSATPTPTSKPPAPATDTPPASPTSEPTQTEVPTVHPTDTQDPPSPTVTDPAQPSATPRPTRTLRPTRTPKP